MTSTYFISLENHLRIIKILDVYNHKRNSGRKEMRLIVVKMMDGNYNKVVEWYRKVPVAVGCHSIPKCPFTEVVLEAQRF